MEVKDFAKVISDGEISIGYIPGSNKVLFIKTGQGGSIYGYENKYLNLANYVNQKYGFSIFASATSSDSRQAYENDIALLEQCLGGKDYEIYFLGVSKGGLIGLWHWADNPRIKRMVCINAPLMINFHGKTLPGTKRLGKENLTMVYGSLDPSYKYIPFVDKWTTVEIIKDADHNLRGLESDFPQMIESLLIKVFH